MYALSVLLLWSWHTFHFYKITCFTGLFFLQKHSKTAQSLLLGSTGFEHIWFYLMFAVSMCTWQVK